MSLISVKRYVDNKEINTGITDTFDTVADYLEEIHHVVAHGCMLRRHEIADLNYDVSLNPPYIKIPIASNQYYLVVAAHDLIVEFISDTLDDLRGDANRKHKKIATLEHILAQESETP